MPVRNPPNLDTYRIAVRRLLDDPHQPEHIRTLLLFLRDRNGGRQMIRDLGDYIAHKSERDRGFLHTLATENASIIASMGFRMSGAPGVVTALNYAALPSFLLTFLSANLKRLDAEALKKATKIKRVEAAAIIKNFNEHHTVNSDSTIKLPQFTDPKQQVLLEYLTTNFAVRTIANQKAMFGEFCSLLLHLQLLKQIEKRAFNKVETCFTLFALAQMHNCDMRNDILKAWTHIGIGDGTASAKLSMDLRCLMPWRDGLEAGMSMQIFATDLSANLCISPELLAEPLPWDFDLEVTKSMTLDRVRYVAPNT